MKANKLTVKIEVEVLSMDSVTAKVADAMEQFDKEQRVGELISEDGDSVKWQTVSKKVEF